MDDQHQTGMSPPPAFDRAGPSNELSQISLWSMILGIISFCLGPLGLVALIMGIVGITQTTGERARRGLGFAIAGTALGALGLLGTCFSAAILLPAISKARLTAAELKSSTQLRSIGQAMVVYAADNDDQFPPTDQTFDILMDVGLLEPELLVSPIEDGDGVSYILTGVREVSYDANEIVAYEDPKHMDSGVNVLFGDMSVRKLSHAEFEAMLAAQQSQQSEP